MTHTIADSQGCPISSPHITLFCTRRYTCTHPDRGTNAPSCPGAIRLTHAVTAILFVGQAWGIRCCTGICLILSTNPVRLKQCYSFYRTGSKLRLRKVKLFEHMCPPRKPASSTESHDARAGGQENSKSVGELALQQPGRGGGGVGGEVRLAIPSLLPLPYQRSWRLVQRRKECSRRRPDPCPPAK